MLTALNDVHKIYLTNNMACIYESLVTLLTVIWLLSSMLLHVVYKIMFPCENFFQLLRFYRKIYRRMTYRQMQNKQLCVYPTKPTFVHHVCSKLTGNIAV